MCPRLCCSSSSPQDLTRPTDVVSSDCQVEFSYPPLMPDEGHDSNVLPEEWRYLPFLALPDGAHNYQEGRTSPSFCFWTTKKANIAEKLSLSLCDFSLTLTEQTSDPGLGQGLCSGSGSCCTGALMALTASVPRTFHENF